MHPEELSKPLTSETFASFRTQHSIKGQRLLNVSYDDIHAESGAGNYVVIPKGSASVYRVVQYRSEDSRTRIDSPTFIGMLQEIDSKAKRYFPLVMGFGKANIEQMRAETPQIIIQPHDSGNYSIATSVPAVEVERMIDEGGWSVKFIRHISHDDGLAALDINYLQSVNPEQLRLDIENSIRTFSHLLDAELLLSQHNRYITDFKGSFATHVGPNGRIDQVKIMDMDDVRYVPDRETRERYIRGELLGQRLLIHDSVRKLLKENPDNPIFNTPEFKMFMQLDLHMRQAHLAPDLQRKLGIQPTTLKQTREMLSQIVNQLETGQGEPAGINVSEYLSGFTQLQQAERQTTRERSDGSIGIAKRFDAWKNFLVESFGIQDGQEIEQISSAISLQNYAKAGELLRSLNNPALSQLGQLLVDFDGDNSSVYYGSCPEVPDDKDKLDPSVRLIQDLFIVAAGLGQGGNVQNVRQFVENLQVKGITNIPEVLVGVLKQ